MANDDQKRAGKARPPPGREKAHPARSAAGQAEVEARRQRQAAALRENLKRRKDQQRAREALSPPELPPSEGDD